MAQQNYLALDIGEKRIGVAVGSFVPFGRGVLDATQPEVIQQIQDIIEKEAITTIIVGVPRVKSGDITASQQNALDWIERLRRVVKIPVEAVDESYSSTEAENQLRHEKVDIRTNKGRVDERAAQLILAQYFEEKK